jgi:hypothetical protein
MRPQAHAYTLHVYGALREILAAEQVVMLRTLRCPVRVVWVYRKTQWDRRRSRRTRGAYGGLPDGSLRSRDLTLFVISTRKPWQTLSRFPIRSKISC